MYHSENTRPLVHDTSPVPRVLAWSKGALAAPDGLCLRPTGAGGSEPVMFDARAAILSRIAELQSG